MTVERGKRHTGMCFDCGGPLELFELDVKKATKVMICQSCGLFHFYRKGFLGKYILLRVTKNPSTDRVAKEG
jgi:NMD protein affecting ribosome stability and mRNA decay